MRPQQIYDLNELELDFDHPLHDIHDIRKVNPQRHEMEQLTGIVYIDREKDGLIGFKDVTALCFANVRLNWPASTLANSKSSAEIFSASVG
jgi:hypothetical protein